MNKHVNIPKFPMTKKYKQWKTFDIIWTNPSLNRLNCTKDCTLLSEQDLIQCWIKISGPLNLKAGSFSRQFVLPIWVQYYMYQNGCHPHLITKVVQNHHQLRGKNLLYILRVFFNMHVWLVGVGPKLLGVYASPKAVLYKVNVRCDLDHCPLTLLLRHVDLSLNLNFDHWPNIIINSSEDTAF